MSTATAFFGTGTRVNTSERDEGNFEYNEQVVVDDSQTRSRDFWIRPIGGVSNQAGPFNFSIERSEDQYLVMNAARLETTCRVVRGDGTPLNSLLDVIAPINLLGPCMWQNIEVRLNGQPLSGSSAVNSGYKSYIDTMLSYDQDSRHTHLLTQFAFADSPKHFDTFKVPMHVLKQRFLREIQRGNITPLTFNAETRDLDENSVKADGTAYTEAEFDVEQASRSAKQAFLMNEYFNAHMQTSQDLTFAKEMGGEKDPNKETNLGFLQRYDIASDSEIFTMFSPIPHDFFNMSNHIAPMNKIDIKLTKYPDNFLLNTFITNKGYKLELIDLKLHLRSITRRERIRPPIKEMYRLNETNLLKQVVPRDMTNYSFRMFNTGVMPKTVIIAMVPTAAAEGAYNYNPFNFHHYHLKRISLSINGEEKPQNGLEFDFKRVNQNVARGYHWLFANTGALSGEKGNLVALPLFQAGAFMVPFDLTPDKCNGVHNHNAELGHIDVNFVWDEPLPEPVTILYELVFNKVLINDKSTNTVSVVDVAV